MDILYVVGKGSACGNMELLFSLRSIAKFGKNVGRVFLVGYKPEFVSDAVTYIPCDDPYPCAHKNILHKVMTAIVESDIDKHFLISSDDHYYTRLTDFDKLPVFYRYKDIPDKVEGRKMWDNYCRSLFDTRWVLQHHGLTTYQTNPHCNTHFDVELYKANKAMFDECFNYQFGIELNCLMGNLLYAKGAKPVKFDDAKLSGNTTTKEIVERAACGCLSSTPRIAGSPLEQYLRKTYDKKCKYEI